MFLRNEPWGIRSYIIGWPALTLVGCRGKPPVDCAWLAVKDTMTCEWVGVQEAFMPERGGRTGLFAPMRSCSEKVYIDAQACTYDYTTDTMLNRKKI